MKKILVALLLLTLLVGCGNGTTSVTKTGEFQTEETAYILAENFDMINVSLKSMSDDFYSRYLRLPSVQPVLRNIAIFKQHAHVEIITPIVQEISYVELNEMTDFLYAIDKNIPWHIFRLYRTHERQDEKGRDFGETISFIEKTKNRLPYTYFGNFPGSRWEDTYCSACQNRVIRRISIGACGAQYLEDSLTDDDRCPICNNPIPIVRSVNRAETK